MNKVRTLTAMVGVIVGALLWALPAHATPGPKVITTITATDCGTATVGIVLAQGVTGTYNARYYVGGDEAGRVPSTGTVPASKTITFPEDSHGGSVELWVSVVDGPESDYRPKTIAKTVITNCKPPVKPVVTATVPTCANRAMVVTVTNPNTLPSDKVKVRIGLFPVKTLGAGESTSRTVYAGVKVWAGEPLKFLTHVKYVRPIGCASPTATASATASPTATASATASPTASATPSAVAVVTAPPMQSTSGGGSDSLPVTGAAVIGALLLGATMIAAGVVSILLLRRRRVRFTA